MSHMLYESTQNMYVRSFPYQINFKFKKRTTTRSAASQSSQSQSKSIVDLPLYQDERREVQDNISSGHPICWHDATEMLVSIHS